MIRINTKSIIFIITIISIIMALTCFKNKATKPPIIEQITDSLIDIDGNIYRSIKIGNQWWMAENLRVKHFRNGDTISEYTSDTNWRNLTQSGYCSYLNDTLISAEFGLLYNGYAMEDLRIIAPEGWHIPDSNEWQILIDFLGGNSAACNKLKEQGTSHWFSTSDSVTNESGFTALPGGYRHPYGYFLDFSFSAYFWTTTIPPPNSGYDYVGITLQQDDRLYYCWSTRQLGYSIRCIKDPAATMIDR